MSLEVCGDLRRKGGAEFLKFALPDSKDFRERFLCPRISARHLA